MVAVSHPAATCGVWLLAAVAPSRKVTELTAGQRQKRVPWQSHDQTAMTPYDTLTAKSLSRRRWRKGRCGVQPSPRGQSVPPFSLSPRTPCGQAEPQKQAVYLLGVGVYF